MEILHITSLEAHTALNIYKPMEINIEKSPNWEIELGTFWTQKLRLNRSVTSPELRLELGLGW